jgi:hypothetical protein
LCWQAARLPSAKKGKNKFKHLTGRNERPRKISTNMVKQIFQTKASRLEELKNVY